MTAWTPSAGPCRLRGMASGGGSALRFRFMESAREKFFRCDLRHIYGHKTSQRSNGGPVATRVNLKGPHETVHTDRTVE
ncbi:hypothetical protein ACFFX0_21655 [Citricoccus parietis]|uniref:Uncharacterized protein n=1 Tax=Citricoccus parietis TaxID=592307 RepID=A0ABV5G5C8_9MICC